MARAPGCLALLSLVLLLLLPLLFANLVLEALAKLGLTPGTSVLFAIGIFLGSAVNIPLRRIPRDRLVQIPVFDMFGLPRMAPKLVRQRTYSVLAVNAGGCLLPGALGVYELARLAQQGLLAAGLLGIGINAGVCYVLARPVPGLGIAMPALVPGLVAALCGVLLAPAMAPPVAFASGVFGTLIGADLLHMREVERIAVGMASIGGAGTFDGIVLSGLIATLLA